MADRKHMGPQIDTDRFISNESVEFKRLVFSHLHHNDESPFIFDKEFKQPAR